jgi:hypothetical protein
MEGLQEQSEGIVPNYRALKAVVIILGALILVALAALVTGMLLGVGPKSPAAQLAEPYTTRLTAAPGAKIAGAQIDGNRLIVHIEDGSGSVVVLDAATGRVLGHIVFEAPQ